MDKQRTLMDMTTMMIDWDAELASLTRASAPQVMPHDDSITGVIESIEAFAALSGSS